MKKELLYEPVQSPGNSRNKCQLDGDGLCKIEVLGDKKFFSFLNQKLSLEAYLISLDLCAEYYYIILHSNIHTR